MATTDDVVYPRVRTLDGANREMSVLPQWLGPEGAFTRWAVPIGLGIAMIPAFLGALFSITNSFLHPTIAFVTRFLGESQMPLDSWPITPTPASPLFIAALAQVSGLAPNVIQFMPFISPLFVIVYFVVAKRLVGNSVVAVMITIALAYGFSEPHYAVWRHSFGLLGILLLILVFLRMLQTRATSQLLLIAILIFFGTRFYSYSLENSMLALTLGATFYSLVFRRTAGRQWLIGLTLLWLVAFFTFNPIWQHELRRQLTLGTDNLALVALAEFFNQRLAILPGFSTTFKEELALVGHFGSSLPITLLQLTYISLIALPLFAFGFTSLASVSHKPFRRFIGRQRSSWLILWWGLVATGLSEVLIYLTTGTVTSRPLLFYGPIMTIMALMAWVPKISKLLVYASVLALLSMTLYIASWSHKDTFYPLSLTRHQSVEASAEWYIDHVPEERWALDWTFESRSRRLGGLDGIFYQSGPYIDHQLGGMFMVKAAERGEFFVQRLFPMHLYQNLVQEQRWNVLNFWGRGKEKATGVYAVINANRYPNTVIRSEGWLDLTPMSQNLHIIKENWNANKIYDDDVVWIIRSRE